MPAFKYADGRWPHSLALLYIAVNYVGSLTLLISGHSVLWLPATLLLAHSLVIAAYMVHECAHNTVFADNAHNARLGAALSWLLGSAYSEYRVIRDKHFRHHVDRADVIAKDFRPLLRRHRFTLKVLQAFELIYVPAFDLLMHAAALLVPFVMPSRRHLRLRVVGVLVSRVAFFAVLGWFSPWALVAYFIAYCLMLHVLRFMDAFQHTYEVAESLEGPRPSRQAVEALRDHAYEQRNTYSNPISLQHPWLNLLMLNFGYHNAHHEKPNEPWYRLPRLHAQLFDSQHYQVIPFRSQISAYHRFRGQRLVNEDPVDMPVLADAGASFVGVAGVSFLTAY